MSLKIQHRSKTSSASGTTMEIEEDASASLIAKMTVDDIVEHARNCRRSSAAGRFHADIERYKAQFNAGYVERPDTRMNIFTFHVRVPATHRVINYVDVKHDHWEFDYQKLTTHLTWATSIFNPEAQVLFVTNQDEAEPQAHCALRMVRLFTNSAAPMLERVKAMAAYVESDAFDRDTAFLDTDAFPNRSFAPIFANEFDVGVTYRTTSGYMPINEGVVFCRHANKAAVRRFFEAYIATYEHLIEDPVIQAYYGNIERWRGGQLSLNAAALSERRPSAGVSVLGGVRIRMLPCNEYNYWVQPKYLERRPASWDKKFVLHLKGDSKRMVDNVIQYQLQRGQSWAARRRPALA